MRTSPGRRLLLGKTYEPTGLAQGEAALADIARHPSTAKFIATKFVRHFVADDPPPALVARLRDVFVKTDGDLKALATALVDSDEAWKAPLTKMRSPYDFLVASGRLLARVPGGSRRLSQQPQSAGPAAVVAGRTERFSRYQRGLGRARRHEAPARHLPRRWPRGSAPTSIRSISWSSPRPMRPRSKRGATIERAESRQQALALLLMSPEMQRR